MSKDKFYYRYKILHPTPKTRASTEVIWDEWREVYTTNKLASDIDPYAETFSRTVVELTPSWFEPIGEAKPYYDKFPDDLSEHFYFGELRHNKMCRFCTVADAVIESEEYKTGVTELFKKLYNAKIDA